MPLDGLALAALAWELNRALAGGRVAKVLQPLDDQLVLQMRRSRDNANLVINVHFRWPGVYTSPGPFEHRLQPPPFCMLLRKYLEGGRLLAVSQPGWERILYFIFETAQPIDDVHRVTLVAELIPRRANLTLVAGVVGTDANVVILDALDRKPGRPDERLPGQPYQGPPQLEKIDPLAGDAKVATVFRLVPPQRRLAQHMSTYLHGLSPEGASALLIQAGIDPDWSGPLEDEASIKRVVASVQNAAAACRQGRVQPGVLEVGTPPVIADAWVLPLPERQTGSSRPGSWIPCRSTDEALGRWLMCTLQAEATQQLRTDLDKFLRNQIQKLQRKLAHREQDLQRAEQADWYKRCGDLLMANLHQLNPKATRQGQVTVTDWFAQEHPLPQVVIPVDPSLTPSANAQRYYHLYSKYKQARHRIEEQLEETRQEIAYLQQVALSVQWSEDRAALEEIAEELRQAGYSLKAPEEGAHTKSGASPGKPAAAKPAPAPRSGPYRIILEDGSEIRVGRNNRQNDLLTLRWAKPDDLWFHASQVPGAHVLLRLPPGSRSPEEHREAVHCALQLAGWFSRAREASKVAVDYTLRKHVRKPKGARPGMVIYDHQRTVMVTLDPKVLQPLLARLQQDAAISPGSLQETSR